MGSEIDTALTDTNAEQSNEKPPQTSAIRTIDGQRFGYAVSITDDLVDYLLIDPFNQGNSGVTTYCRLVKSRLIAMGWRAEIIARNPKEDLEHFRRRLPATLESHIEVHTIIEAPETLAVTRYWRDARRLHIRLHGSRHFGAWLQHLKHDAVEQALEQVEVDRAWHVSAPSHAAVATHRLHFGTPRLHPQIYPNPAPQAQTNSDQQPSDADFLFLGRWQPLKGTHFYLELAQHLPHLRFAAACTDQLNEVLPNFCQWPAHTTAQKNSALKRASVVVIPSLFETASMVGLEALAASRTIVTWNHIGIAEYGQAPEILTAEPWDLDDLIEKARIAVNDPRNCSFSNVLQRINSSFDGAVASLIKESPPPRTDWLPTQPPIDYRKIFAAMPLPQNASQKHVFQRKFRKLLRDPAAYWRDSAVRRTLFHTVPSTPPQGDNTVTHKEGPTSITTTAAAPVPLPVPATTHAEPAESSKRPSAVIGEIGAEGFIKLKAPVKGINGWRVCIAHPTDESSDVDSLVLQLNEFSDFSPTLAKKINLLPFRHDPDEPIPSLINRIDQKNKEIIAQLDHLLLINAPANLAVALRHCAPLNRTVSILTKDQLPYATADESMADALISISTNAATNDAGWRRKVIVPGTDNIAAAILRVVRETGPKTIDMLIRITGNATHDPSLHDFNPTRFQGRILLKSASLPLADSMHEFIDKLGHDISDIYVLESIYTRYRSMCTDIENGGHPGALIESCLKDGVLFDVA